MFLQIISIVILLLLSFIISNSVSETQNWDVFLLSVSLILTLLVAIQFLEVYYLVIALFLFAFLFTRLIVRGGKE